MDSMRLREKSDRSAIMLSLMKERGDGLDKYRRESNQILTQRAAESP